MAAQEPAVRQTDADLRLMPQGKQPLSKHRVLSFEPALRVAERGEEPEHKTDQRDHFSKWPISSRHQLRWGFGASTFRIRENGPKLD